jgi:hypothetical protein
MAGTSSTTIVTEVLGIDEPAVFSHKSNMTATPIKATKTRQIQAVADTDEAVNLCGISTVERLSIKCIANDVDVDLNYSSSFSADFTIPAGESVTITQPVGVTQIKNNGAAEAVTIDIIIVGSA